MTHALGMSSSNCLAGYCLCFFCAQPFRQSLLLMTARVRSVVENYRPDPPGPAEQRVGVQDHCLGAESLPGAAETVPPSQVANSSGDLLSYGLEARSLKPGCRERHVPS